MRTYEQKMAERAFQCVKTRIEGAKKDEYSSFAMSFPALIHSCGLAQAVSFAEAKDRDYYLEDLNEVLNAFAAKENKVELSRESREADLVDYMRLSRRAVTAASWLKRYVEALYEKEIN